MRQPFAVALIVLGILPAGAAAHPGIGIVADKAGNVFYTDLRQVLVIDCAGRVSIAVPRVHTHELYVDGEDSLFGEHLWYEGDQTGQWGHRVWKRTPDGAVIDVIPSTRGFRTTFEFVRDAAGHQYWVGDEAGDAARTRTTLFVRPARGSRRAVARGFVNARWIAAAADGTVYVLDDRQIKRVSTDGSVRVISPRLASGLAADFVGGITADDRGHVYVANYGAARVERIDANGRVAVFARSGLRYGPTGVLVKGDEVWVLESGAINAVRVRRFRRDGTLIAVYSR